MFDCSQLPKVSIITTINICRRQFAVVKLPDSECTDCAIRLIRQGAEYASSYAFWSCADVSVVSCLGTSSLITKTRDAWLNAFLETLAPKNGGKSEEKYNSLLEYMKENNISLNSKPQKEEVPACEPNKPGCYDGLCLNGGTCDDATGQCSCHRLFSGDRCQYKGDHNRFSSLYCRMC